MNQAGTIERDLAGLGRLTARVGRWLGLPDERLTVRAPERSGWSVAAHLFHLSFANEMSLENAARLVAGKGRLIRPREARVPEAERILQSGRLPYGTEAPRFVQPPPRIDLAFLREVAAGVRTKLGALADEPQVLAAAPDGIPHQALGVLSAAEWVRFARMHTAHHLAILRGLAEGP
jgi:hypothetical protein